MPANPDSKTCVDFHNGTCMDANPQPPPKELHTCSYYLVVVHWEEHFFHRKQAAQAKHIVCGGGGSRVMISPCDTLVLGCNMANNQDIMNKDMDYIKDTPFSASLLKQPQHAVPPWAGKLRHS